MSLRDKINGKVKVIGLAGALVAIGYGSYNFIDGIHYEKQAEIIQNNGGLYAEVLALEDNARASYNRSLIGSISSLLFSLVYVEAQRDRKKEINKGVGK